MFRQNRSFIEFELFTWILSRTFVIVVCVVFFKKNYPILSVSIPYSKRSFWQLSHFFTFLKLFNFFAGILICMALELQQINPNQIQRLLFQAIMCRVIFNTKHCCWSSLWCLMIIPILNNNKETFKYKSPSCHCKIFCKSFT